MTPVDHFNTFLTIHQARDQIQKNRAYNVRHQVYCQEFNFEPLRPGEPELESDAYDAQSAHCLLTHKPTGRAIGCARLVMADQRAPERPLPFELHCSHSIDKSLFDPDEYLPGQLVEFSRIAVVEKFRRREARSKNSDLATQESVVDERRLSKFPVIPVSLFLALASMQITSQADIGFAMMEPKLARLLRRFGLFFEPVGEPIDYHGWRSPFIIRRDKLLRNLKPEVRKLFDNVHGALHMPERPVVAEQRQLEVVC